MTLMKNGIAPTADSQAVKPFPLCAVVSMENGEDPIGTALNFNHLLALELSPPWPEDVWQAKHVPDGLVDLFQQARNQGLALATQAILPNPTYQSRPGWTRIFSLRRPIGPFALYHKEEFLVPNREIAALVEALLLRPAALSRFDVYRQRTSHVRELLICTHGNRDVCCGKFGFPAFQALSQHALKAPQPFRVWRTSHFGGHRFAPTVLDLPEGRCWGHLDMETLENLALHEGRVSQLYALYRGWSALSVYEQVAEREVFMRHGWGWVNYLKDIRTVALDKAQDRAEVWLDYTSPDGRVCGAYQATVELSHWASTLSRSGDQQPKEVKQYHVSHLLKVFENSLSVPIWHIAAS